MTLKDSLTKATACAAALWMFSSPAHSATSCAGVAFCAETSAFVAALTNFRTSANGPNRVLTATLNLHNKTPRPLILGYVSGTGVALDELGNRYTISNSEDVRGIGAIRRNTFDPKFTLQPGESSDARFNLHWHAGRSIAGIQFDLELALREIDAVAGDQHRLGKEHALRFAGLSDTAGSNAAAPVAATPAAAIATDAAAADPCAGIPRCYAAGPFVAEVVQLAPMQPRQNQHIVRVGIRFRNVSNQPLILAYQTNSGTMLDDYGQQYSVDWRSKENVAGIGQTSRNKADPQFVLSPGEARSATFNYSRYIGKSAIGTVFSPDLVIEQLEILPSQQIRSVRDYAVSFANVSSASIGSSAAASTVAGEAPEAIQNITEAGRKLGEGLKSLFKKKE